MILQCFLASLALVTTFLPLPVSACIFKYGTSADSLAAPSGGTPWDHGFHGDDWSGVDSLGRPWQCLTGTRQSPINVPVTSNFERRGSMLPQRFRTSWSYPTIISNGSDIEVINTGHTIQVEWLSPYPSNVQITVPANPDPSTRITSVLEMRPGDQATTVRATPLQFHFHALSEHVIAGKYYPLELHIVHRITDLPACSNGCFSVTGVLFELTDGEDNRLLDAIWAAMPMREGAINYLPAGAEVRLGELLPPPSDRDYVTYEGSLTTPPCTEGLLWHVIVQPQKISRAQWIRYQTIVGFKECTFNNGTAISMAEISTIRVPSNMRSPRNTNRTSTRSNRVSDGAAPARLHRHLLTLQDSQQQQRHQQQQQHAHTHRRFLASTTGGNPDDYTCRVVAYGTNYRSTQLSNDRIIKMARAVA